MYALIDGGLISKKLYFDYSPSLPIYSNSFPLLFILIMITAKQNSFPNAFTNISRQKTF